MICKKEWLLPLRKDSSVSADDLESLVWEAVHRLEAFNDYPLAKLMLVEKVIREAGNVDWKTLKDVADWVEEKL